MKTPNTLTYSLERLALADKVLADASQRRNEWRADVGWQVRATRKARGISQTELARMCGVSKMMLSDFEHGRRWSDRLVASLIKHLL